MWIGKAATCWREKTFALIRAEAIDTSCNGKRERDILTSTTLEIHFESHSLAPPEECIPYFSAVSDVCKNGLASLYHDS